MKRFRNGSEAVSNLHNNGFTDDFQSFGNGIMWVQEQLFIGVGEFTILVHHRIVEPKVEFDVFGILAPFHNTKGILINHFRRSKVNKNNIKQYGTSFAHGKFRGK
jgi:hypothetical protein